MLFTKTILALAAGAGYAAAQASTPYTDAKTGISGQRYVHAGTGYSFGIAFPTTPGEEFIGQLVGPRKGWSGVSLGGGMTNSLLIAAWVDEDKVVSSFRKASSYVEPGVYEGDAKATTLYSSANATHFTWTFRCEKCTNWGDRSFDPAAEVAVMGFAISSTDVTEPLDPGSALPYHDFGMGQYAMRVKAAASADYQKWIDEASPPTSSSVTPPSSTGSAYPSASEGPSSVVEPTSTPSGTSVPTVVPTNVLGDSYDYIVVGGGAGGLVAADRLSESGAKVLLIERGPPSTYAHGGRIAPKWLERKELTRFDVPGLCNQIWADSKGIACEDLDKMAGCVLGGGTAVNSGMFFRPQDRDWDYNFPEGWKASDMAAATEKLFERIPGTDTPSMDGQRYLQETFNVIGSAVAKAGWNEVTINQKPNEKYRTYAHAPFMFSNGQRGGPLATYLVSAKQRSNFQLVLNTSVRRVIRTGSKAEGVEVFASSADGKSGIYKLAAGGKVILSAGALSTPKILFRSGIGPKDQLQVVKGSASDGPTMIDEKEWIISPVGFNAIDHTNTDIVVSHPQIKGYDFYGAYNSPIQSDMECYLNNRSGVLAGAAPGIPLVLYDRVQGADGIERQLQYTARSEGSLGESGPNLITISQYLGTGMTSRGRLTIKPNLDMTVSSLPYVKKAEDEGAIIDGLTKLVTALGTYGNGLTILHPNPSLTIEEYVKGYVQDRGTNHWMGTAKMGLDDGTKSNGTSGAVVDCDTKVYGTDNLYVIDASIFPGTVATNPSAPILIAAEHAVARILGYKPERPVTPSGSPVPSSVPHSAPYGNATVSSIPTPIGTGSYPSHTSYEMPDYPTPSSSGSPVGGSSISYPAPSSDGIGQPTRSVIPDPDPSVGPEPSINTDLEPTVKPVTSVDPIHSSHPDSASVPQPTGSNDPDYPAYGNGSISSYPPIGTGGTTVVLPTETSTPTATPTPTLYPTPTPEPVQPTKPKKCGGVFWKDEKKCAPGQVCQRSKKYWWVRQCVTPVKSSKPTIPTKTTKPYGYKPRGTTRYTRS